MHEIDRLPDGAVQPLSVLHTPRRLCNQAMRLPTNPTSESRASKPSRSASQGKVPAPRRRRYPLELDHQAKERA
jgi:hypothetical protein